MSHSDCPNRLIVGPLAAAVATLLLATPTLAQQARPGEQMGMRYLSWAGKPATQAADDLRRPGDGAPRQQLAAMRAAPAVTTPSRPSRYGSGNSGLTPASAWVGAPDPGPMPEAQTAPRFMPMPTRQQAPQSMPTAMPQQAQDAPQTASAPDYDAGRSFRRQDPYFAAPPQVQAAMQPTPQPTYMPPPAPIPTATDPAAAPAGYDPMAPRPDAPVFHMGRPAPTQAPVSNEPQPDDQAKFEAQNAPHRLAQAATRPGDPPREGARYYSVHREAGREPDPLTLPESVFIGGGTTADLAEPPPVPVQTRTINGRTQVVQNQTPGVP